MHKPGLLPYVAQFAPGLFRVHRSTWITVGVGLLVFLGFLIWAAMALIGWLWGWQGLRRMPCVARRVAS